MSDMPEALARVRQELRLHDMHEVLDLVSRISWDASPYSQYVLPGLGEDLRRAARIRQHDLAYFVRAAVVASDVYRKARKTAGVATVAHLLNLANDCDGPDVVGGDWGAAGLDDWDRYFVRKSFQQFPFQENPLLGLARARYLWEEVGRELPDAGMDVAEEWERVTGLSLPDAHFVLFGMLATRMAGVFSASELRGKFEVRWRQKVDAFLEAFSASPRRLREVALDRAVPDDTYEYYQHNPLCAWPLVALPGGTYVAPSLPLLLRRFGEGPYYDLFTEHMPPPGQKGNRFAEAYGHLFEEYVCRQLETHLGRESVVREFEYGAKKSQRRFTDATVVSGAGAVLFECKAGRLQIASKTTAEDARMLGDVVKTSVGAVEQLSRRLADLQDAAAAEPRLATVSEAWPVVVYSDQMALINSPTFTHLIDAQLREEAVGLRNRHQGIDIADLEFLVTLGHPEPVVGVVARKAADRERATWSFGGVLREADAQRKFPQNQLLAAKLDEIWADARSKLKS